MIGWLLLAAFFVVLFTLPIGLRLVYEANGLKVFALIGSLAIALYPVKRKQDKSQKNDFSENRKQTGKPGGSVVEFLPLLRSLLDLLLELRCKLFVSDLEFVLILGGTDPCEIGTQYGRAWAIIGSLMPLLERTFVIKKHDIGVTTDFLAGETSVYARADVKISFIKALWLALKYGVRCFKQYHSIISNKKAVQ